jgi:hypothetical protein
MTPLLAALLIAALVTFVVLFVSGPLRRGGAPAVAAADSDERHALESAKEAKYAEIRDNQTDFATGKLSEEDFRALDGALRAEAVEILRRIDDYEARSAPRTGAVG